jgi:uncharacterized membrane protein YdbT with pleckstrin-like domain
VGYVERHLLPGERVLYKTRLHWILFWRAGLVTAGGLVLTGILWWVTQPAWLWYIGVGVVLVGVIWALVEQVELRTSEFAVTTTRLIFKVGLVARYTTELLLPKVESIAVNQGLVGRLLNFGDLTVTGAGGAREQFRRVRDPIGFRNHVQQASMAAGGRTGD